jgi:hypothetical protein
LWDGVEHCNIDSIKEAVLNGANINATKNNKSPFESVASHAFGPCADIARLLSEAGAYDSGFTKYNSSCIKYDKPKVFEDDNLRITIPNVYVNGYSAKVTFFNKTEKNLRILGEIVNINGKELGFNADAILNPYGQIMDYLQPPSNGKTKIVNNKVSFTRQITIEYSINGKKYALKTPVIQESFDVRYVGDYGQRTFNELSDTKGTDWGADKFRNWVACF